MNRKEVESRIQSLIDELASKRSLETDITTTTLQLLEQALLLKNLPTNSQTPEVKEKEKNETQEPEETKSHDLFNMPPPEPEIKNQEPTPEPEEIKPEPVPELKQEPAAKPAPEPSHSINKGSSSDEINKIPVGDLKSVIGINEKFQFINELFDGNMKEYNVALDQLNNFSNLEEAEAYLENIMDVYKWESDDPIAGSFKELVQRRFS